MNTPEIVSKDAHFAIGSVVTTPDGRIRNPAVLYVLTMNTDQSRNKVAQLLNLIAREFGYHSLAECPWSELTAELVLSLKTRWEMQKKAPATINFALTVLRGVIKQAWLDEQISDRTYRRICAIKPARGSREPHGRALSNIETYKLLEDCETDGSLIGLRDAAIFAVGIGGGLRRTEICTLAFENLLPAEGRISIVGKGNKQRSIYLGAEVWKRLNAWIEARREALAQVEAASDSPLSESGPVFCAVLRGGNLHPEKPLTANGIYIIMRRHAEKLGLESFSPHDLRRTYATRLFQMGGHIQVVSRAMGHASIITTQRYDKSGDEEVKRLSSNLPLF